MKYRKPDARGIANMLEMIAGDDLKVKDADAFDDAARSHQAIFADPDGTTVATCDCDLKCAVALGCSLSMIPVAGMESMLEEKSMSAAATNNFYEVMNIFSSLFLADGTPHLKLTTVSATEFVEVAGEPVTETKFSIDLGKYGGGLIRFRSL